MKFLHIPGKRIVGTLLQTISKSFVHRIVAEENYFFYVVGNGLHVMQT